MSDLSEDLEDLYETAPCGFASLSPGGRIVKANRTLAGWLGQDQGELVGRLFHEILGFGGKIAFETHLAPLLRMQGHVYEIALDLVCQDGEKIPAIVNAAEKRDSEGRHLFTRITLFKAVDRRTYERTLLEARLRAESESRAEKEAALLREQFIAILGHDLRNPISAIDAGVRMLEKSEAMGPKGRRILDEIHGCVARAQALIADSLDFARGRLGGGIALQCRYERLTPLLDQVVGEIRAIAPDHRIEADVSVADPVYCDSSRLGQLISNLLGNAVAHGDPSCPIQLVARTADGFLHLSVANQAEPIPQELLDRLFQPFIRNRERSSGSGLGLGLFIASEIAKAHGGSIAARSSGRLISFDVTLPATAPGDGPGDRTED